MRLVILSDVWLPQINGLVRVLDATRQHLRQAGDEVEVVSAETMKVRMGEAWAAPMGVERAISRTLRSEEPDAIHIATEGIIGWAAHRLCGQLGLRFTSSPCVVPSWKVNLAGGLELDVTPALMRRFHGASSRVMVASETMRQRLETWGVGRVVLWPRGVDGELFRPAPKDRLSLPRPVFMFAGRLSPEKGLEEFLALDLPGTKVVVGDGPLRAEAAQRHPEAVFTGLLLGESYSSVLAAADVLVFPGQRDVTGNVMLEALACGVPVAAYPVPGPQDVIRDPRVGVLDWDLRAAALKALKLNPSDCREYALNQTWAESAATFRSHLVSARDGRPFTSSPPASVSSSTA